MSVEPIHINTSDPLFVPNPYALYKRLRVEAPVYYSEDYQAWFLSGYHEIKSVFKDDVAFGFPNRFNGPQNLQPDWTETTDTASSFEGYLAIRSKTTESQALWIANRDTEDHNRIRKAFNPPFMPAHLKVSEPALVDLVNQILEKLKGKHEMDVIADLSVPLTSRVFLNLLGIGYEYSDWIQEQSVALSKLFFLRISKKEKEQGLMALTSFMNFFKERIKEHGIGSNNGLLSLLLEGQCLGRISLDEILANLSFFILAGVQSTIYFIGNIFYCLQQNPDQLALLKADHSLVEPANEEVLRMETANSFSARYTLSDVEILGQKISKGQKIVLLTGSANRDEKMFENADQFLIRREPNPHLAFGYATRYCIGAYLSKLEAKVALQTMLQRFPHFSFNPQPDLSWYQNFRIRGLNHFKVKLHD